MHTIEKLTRTQLWQLNYLRRPYLKDASDEQIADRLRYVIENMTALTPAGQIGVLDPEPDGKIWYEMMAHVQEAYRGRGGPPPQFLTGAMVPRPTFPAQPAAVSALRDVVLPPAGSYLVKFGRNDHMHDLHEHGRIRVGPARGYANPSLNTAVRDDELKVAGFALRPEVKMEAFDHKTGRSMGPIEPIGNVTCTSEARTDFYVYCMGLKLDIRLFGDFGYDACVIIREPKDFMTRMFKAVEKQLPGWEASCRPVHYYDPFNWKRNEMTVFFSKHHRYWYQREYRFGWLPPLSAYSNALEPIHVELGSLRENTQLIVLDA